jgi:diguanylate cyclase (GGDEF)-like protein
MGTRHVEYARLLREVLPVHLLDETVQRVVRESQAEGSQASLYGACSLVLDSLCAKGLFTRCPSEAGGESGVTYHDRSGLLRVDLRSPQPDAERFRFPLRPSLPPGAEASSGRRDLEAVLTGIAASATEDALGDSLREIARYIETVLPGSRARFFHPEAPPPATAFEPAERSVLAHVFPDHIRTSGEPLYVPDLAREPRLAPRAAEQDVRSAAVLPLRAGDDAFGALEVHHAEPEAFDEDALGLLSFFALLAAGRIRSAKSVEKMIYVDLLTGVFTRRFFEEQILRELERANREGSPLALVMVDLDNFKEVNDRFGHPAGDAALARVAEILRDHVRRIDLVTRYGGEEFAILLPGASREQARVICERLRSLVEKAPVPEARGEPFRLTTSIGVALHPESVTPGADAASERKELLDRADQALYEAKRSGKNRVSFWSAPPR